MTLFFRQFWKDERLVYESSAPEENIVAESGYSEKIWVPDTFFVNERKAIFHQIPSPNEFIRIMPDGNVLRSVRYVEMESPFQNVFLLYNKNSAFPSGSV